MHGLVYSLYFNHFNPPKNPNHPQIPEDFFDKFQQAAKNIEGF
jgi:hypothetical protein